MAKYNKCDFCGKSRKDLETHMRKEHQGNEAKNPRKEDEIPSSYVTVNEKVDKLFGVVESLSRTVKELAERPAQVVEKTIPEIPGTADLSKVKDQIAPQQTTQVKLEEPPKEKMPVPPAWRKMVDDILGMDFGIDVVYPSSGSGFLFKIIVPEEKSNMSKDYKEFYRVDVRTKAVNYNEGIDGIKTFCLAVKKNLERQPTAV